MRTLLNVMKYFIAALIAFAVSRVLLHLSVKLALLIDSGALFFVSLFLLAGAVYVFVFTFRKALPFVEKGIKRVDGKWKRVEMKNRKGAGDDS